MAKVMRENLRKQGKSKESRAIATRTHTHTKYKKNIQIYEEKFSICFAKADHTDLRITHIVTSANVLTCVSVLVCLCSIVFHVSAHACICLHSVVHRQ